MHKIKLFSFLFACGLLLGGCGVAGAGNPPADEGTRVPDVGIASEPEPEPEPIVSTLAVCGDIMSHMSQTQDAWDNAAGRYDYSTMISGAREWVQKADYAVANLETTFSGGPNYSGYPAFNSPDELAGSLKAAGFDLMLTANNHSMDRGFKGLARTLDVLDEQGLAHVGTYRTQEERDAHHGVAVADVGGISVAFLGYTYGTNGIPVAADKAFSINLFNLDYMTALTTPDTEKIKTDLAAARALSPDLICVMIHWGNEYQTKQNDYQEQMARLLFENGADMILGGHSHVPQPMEMRTVSGPDGQEKQGFVSFSLGNFISAQNDRYTDTTAVLNLTLEKDQKTGKAIVRGYDYAPLLMLDREKGASVRHELLDVHKTLREGNPDAWLREKLEQAVIDCAEIFGGGDDVNAGG